MPTAPEYVLFALEDCIRALLGEKDAQDMARRGMEALNKQFPDAPWLDDLRMKLEKQ